MEGLTLQYITHDSGIRLMTYQLGSGPDVLLLHGLTSAALTWQRLAERLVATGHRVTMVDGRGHGVSDRAGDYRQQTLAADAAGVIRALGLEKPTVIGHSMGGAQTLQLVSTYPELVGRAIVEDPAIWQVAQPHAAVAANLVGWRANLVRMLPMTHEALVAEMTAANTHWHPLDISRDATAKQQLDPGVLLFDYAKEHAVWEWLQPVDVPITVLHPDGSSWGLVDRPFAAALAAYLPQCTTIEMAGVGHCMRADDFETYWGHVSAVLP